MSTAFICDAVRTPIGRYGGGLSSVRTDDLGAIPIRTLIERNNGIADAIDRSLQPNATPKGDTE